MPSGFTKNYRNLFLHCHLPKNLGKPPFKRRLHACQVPKRSSTPVGTNNSPFCWMDLSGWVDLRVVSFFQLIKHGKYGSPKKNLQSGHLTVFRQLFRLDSATHPGWIRCFPSIKSMNPCRFCMLFAAFQSFNHSYRCTEVAKIPIPSIGKENRRTHPLKRN